MTQIARDYRARFATLGATSVAGNVDFTIDSVNAPDDGFLLDIEGDIAGQEVEPTRGRTTSLPVNIIVSESQAGEEFVQHISNSAGRANMMRRLVDVSMSEDGGTNWTVWATSRVADLLEVEPGKWQVTLLDERMRERELEAFGSALRFKANGQPDPTDLTDVDSLRGADGTTLYPMGLHEEWATVQGVDSVVSEAASPEGEERLEYEVTEVSGNLVKMEMTKSGGTGRANSSILSPHGVRLILTETVKQFFRDDVKSAVDTENPPDPDTTATDGDFRHLCINVGGTNRELMAKGVFQAEGEIGTKPSPEDDPDARIVDVSPVWVVWPTGQPSVGETFRCYLWAPTAPASKATPHHIGGTGTNLAALAKTLYTDGGLLIDGTAFDDAADRTQVVGALSPESPQDFSRFVEEHIWQVIGHAPVVNPQGQISPIDVRLPDADRITLSSLPTVDASDLSEPPSFRHVSDEFVTKLTFRWEGVRNVAAQASVADADIPGGTRGDLVLLTEKTQSREHDRIDELFTVTREVRLNAIHSAQVAGPLIEDISRAIFNRYGDGPVHREAKGLTSLEDRTLGEFVKLNVDIAPNVATGSRGGDIVAQILSRPLTLQGPAIRLLDGGPATTALTTPTLALAQAPNAPKRALVATISSLPTGASYVVQIATNATAPPASSDLWQTVATGDANETTIVGPLPAGETHWGRVQARAPGRISSSWSTPVSQATAAYTPPSSPSVTLTLNGIRAAWTNGEAEIGLRLEIDGTFAIKVAAGTSEVDITDLQFDFDPSTAYNSPGLAIFHQDPQGGTSTSATQSFTTGTASKAPDVCDGRAVGREELAG